MQEVSIKEGEWLSVTLSGEIDAGNADEFYQEVISAYEKQPKNVEFSCAGLEFIDSTTLGTFVKLLKHIKSDGNRMKICALSPRLKKLFVICALDTIMEIE